METALTHVEPGAAALDPAMQQLLSNFQALVGQARQYLTASGGNDGGQAAAIDQAIQNLELRRIQVLSGGAPVAAWKSDIIAASNSLEALVKQMTDQQVAPAMLLNQVQNFQKSIAPSLARAAPSTGAGMPVGLMLGILGIAGLGWWAYSSMKKDRKKSFGDADDDGNALDDDDYSHPYEVDPEQRLEDYQDEDDYLQLGSHRRGRRPRGKRRSKALGGCER